MNGAEFAADAEAKRLARLRALKVLDSEPEVIFDQATALAATLCFAPIALISLVDADRQWFKSKVGLDGTAETARFMAFCSETCRSDSLLEVPDASLDPRFAKNPFVVDEPGIRFYAGAPIIMPQGERVGALCVIDRAPRHLTDMQRTALTGLSRMVATALLERERRIALIDDLARTEATYRTVVEGQSDLVSLANEAGSLTYVNNAYSAFFGLRPEAMLGRSLFDFVAERDRDAVATRLRQVSERGEVAGEANRMISAEGAERWVTWTNRRVPAQDGRGTLIHSVGRDITERRASALMLRESRHLLKMVLDNVPARISYWDTGSRNQFGNQAFLDGFGVTQEAIAGKHARDVLGSDWYDRIQAPIDRGLAGEASRLEVSFAAAGAIRRDVEMHFTPDLRAGEVHGLFVFALDVSARREAERSLADRERRFKQLIDGVRDYAIYMLDSQGRVATWSVGAESIKGYRAADVIGRPFSMFFTPEDIAAGTPENELALAAIDGQFETEGWRVRAGGRKFWAGIWLSAIRGERGELIGYAKITRDLTELMRQKSLVQEASY